ncbi:hypothetical protein EXIGLDRAFT_33850 [Exidia glandulosa HHB12029]|uniref:Uncharacterized protein n=1 Tax=Exidia glandulosa HHB12029 TaxID=1314781 RepID=A0A165ITN9_EXIGL|nr:hypothetical protein EXIGLDRAFT_33850 [Exidia glandulosa HHB12029]
MNQALLFLLLGPRLLSSRRARTTTLLVFPALLSEQFNYRICHPDCPSRRISVQELERAAADSEAPPAMAVLRPPGRADCCQPARALHVSGPGSTSSQSPSQVPFRSRDEHRTETLTERTKPEAVQSVPLPGVSLQLALHAHVAALHQQPCTSGVLEEGGPERRCGQ